MKTVGRLAVYTGSFDPMTYGHLDIIQRAATLFDALIVAIGVARGKKPLFSVEERIAMISASCAQISNIKVESFSGLAVNYARKVGAVALVRGVRSSADYHYEMQMSHMNRALEPSLETLLLPTNPQFAHISSSLTKEVVALGGEASLMVPPQVARHLVEKLRS